MSEPTIHINPMGAHLRLFDCPECDNGIVDRNPTDEELRTRRYHYDDRVCATCETCDGVGRVERCDECGMMFSVESIDLERFDAGELYTGPNGRCWRCERKEKESAV